MSNQLKGPAGFDCFYSQQEGQRWAALKTACARPNQHFVLTDGLQQPYFLDEASILAGDWLETSPGMLVLDLCAAPGGKTLVVAQDLFQLTHPTAPITTGQLVANERSADRRSRLKRVIADHLPPVTLPAIKVTGHDAARWGQHQPNHYDRILLDAPCSSERHLIQNPKYLADWSVGRSTRLAQQAKPTAAARCTWLA